MTKHFWNYVCRELKLRNYTPEDEELKERQVPKAKPASGENTFARNLTGCTFKLCFQMFIPAMMLGDNVTAGDQVLGYRLSDWSCFILL